MAAPTQMLSGLLLLSLFLSLCFCYWREALRDEPLNRRHEDYYTTNSVTKQDKPNPLAVIDTSSGQDGTISPTLDYPTVSRKKIVLINRLLPKLVQSRYMGYWQSARSRWLDIGQKKKERGLYPAILTEQAWSIKDSSYGIKHQIFHAGQSPYPERAR